MRPVLMTTCIIKRDFPDVLKRALSSIEENVDGLDTPRMLLLLQNCAPEQLAAFPPLPSFVVPLFSPSMLSLSAARNVMLNHASQNGWLTDDALIGFPDDDCWYPSGLMAQLLAWFEGDSELDFLFCHYATSTVPVDQAAGRMVTPSARDTIRNASSNTIFLRGSLVDKIGLFDADIGVGAPNNGGEDVEYALRAYLGARKSAYVPLKLVGHRDKTNDLRAKYYDGSLLALRRHAGRGVGVGVQYLRKLFVGLALVMKGELPLNAFIKAIGKTPAPLPVMTGKEG